MERGAFPRRIEGPGSPLRNDDQPCEVTLITLACRSRGFARLNRRSHH